MSRVLRPSGILGTIGPPAAAFFSVWLFCKLPREVIDVALIWTLMSVPPAVLFGHCALSSQR
jgi:hypothetical protein